ncbi:MAG: serine hydrolase domain-containing protein [Polaribacter sp.]|uniref:serine hydrolase domain-containing protein n=1 Tax=Polaribacter sp. TaxID=1920175 RepID=UPI00384D650F
MKLKSIILLAFCFFIFDSGIAQINNISEDLKAKIDSTYTSLLKKNKVTGTSIAIVDNGEIVYATGYGFSDLENKKKADANTIYGIGSITKAFTALSVMQLQEQEKLKVTNSIKDYLVDLDIENPFNDGNQIYINDILSHTSGLPSDVLNGFFVDNPPAISWVIKELNKQRMISPRQYTWAYSNVGYGLLGELIARVSGVTYADYLKQNIFTPLNMTSSSIGYELSNTSKTYDGKKQTKEPSIRDEAAGFMSSNVIDMSNFITMLISDGSFNTKQIIAANSLAEMEKDQLTNVLLASPYAYGYALEPDSIKIKNIKKNDSTVVSLIGHGGATHAFHADFGYLPELKVGAVILTNSVNGGSINSASKLLKIYLENAKNMEVDLDYSSPMSYKGTTPKDDEILGKYNLAQFIIDVKDVNKIKIKQGLSKLILKKKSNSNNYTAKAWIFGIIPKKMKGQEFKFEKLNNEIYVKQVSTKSKKEYYIGKKKTAHLPIPDSWKSMYGKYELTGEIYTAKDHTAWDISDVKMTVSEKNGVLKIDIKSKSILNFSFYFDIISDTSAVLGGVGRGTGGVARILENGNLYYSGFEFSKTK